MAPVDTKMTGAELSEAKRALLARRLKGLGMNDGSRPVMPRAPGAKTPISVDQYRIWLHHSMHPELPTYNEPMTILHDGPLDPALLKKSFEFYAGRHEAWRTTFQQVDDELVQQVQQSLELMVPFTDLRGMPEAEREAEAQWLATVTATQPFDLTRAPLFRVRLTRMSDTVDRIDLVAHHTIFDGTAIRDSLMPELAKIYAAFEAGEEPELAPVQLQYGDYALWRAEQVASQSTQFWRETLAGDLPVARLPFDRSRPALQSQRGAMERFSFSPELTAKLCDLSTRQGGTLFSVLLVTLQLLLFRYSGQNDVIVGTSANGRRKDELQGMMGCILDVFPVRVHPRAETPFVEFLREGQRTFLNSLDAAEVPFEDIVKAIGVKRDNSYHPIYQTFFSFLPFLPNPPQGWDLLPKLIDTGSSKFDIYVEAEERNGGVAACILYNTDVFEKSTIQRMIGHWITLAEAACAAPETPLGQLPLLTPAEREMMLVTWNQTSSPLPDKTFVDLFEEQVKRTPDKVAVQFEKEQLTFAQLDERSDRFAVVLREAGATTGAVAAMCVHRSENMLALMIGILKTGATYMPLDPGTPLSRITLCLEDATPAVLVVESSLADKVPMDGTNVLTMDDFVARAMALPAGSPLQRARIKHEDIAYIIHTSGSTGRPKGVELPHRALLNVLLAMQREPGLKPDDVMVAVTTVSFDISVTELLLPVVSGTKLVIAPRAVAMDPFELSDLMDEVGCTVFQATPATWRGLLAIEWPGRPGLLAQCGGEAMTRDMAEKLLPLGLDLWNMYGPTEATIWSTFYRVESRPSGSVPIGKPIDNYTAYILDANLMPVPIGVPGELYIGGAGLARGYRGQPEMTAQRFISLPVAGGERVYRTGDYAVYRADGTIECQGRADNQVKVRGYRIELEEVELHLSSHPDVVGAAAQAWEETTGSFRLSGYVVPREGTLLQGQDVRDFLKGRLPEYMIPSDFVVLKSLPQTSNGKTDRKALPRPEDAPADRVMEASAAPATPQEQRMAQIWAEVLGVKQVGRTDNFFELGGHSLLLVQLFARINREFHAQLPITTIFDAQTLEELAKMMAEDKDLSSLVPVQPEGTKTPLFVAHSYLLYRALSTALGTDQPLYGLRELETDGHMSLEERAQRYVKEMRAVQPKGPYQIAGWCAAGPLAVEIAQQVLRVGQQVSEVILFDAWMPGYAESVEASYSKMTLAERLFDRATDFWDRFRELSMGDRFSYVGRVLRRRVVESRDNFYVRHWSQVNELSKKLKMPLPQFMHNTSLQTFAALREFCATPTPLHITLIRASETRRPRGGSESCGWEEVAERGVKVLWAPGDHVTMFQDDKLKVTAKLVAETLEAAKAG
jgi:amino acid adenylation domain-containing protein